MNLKVGQRVVMYNGETGTISGFSDNYEMVRVAINDVYKLYLNKWVMAEDIADTIDGISDSL